VIELAVILLRLVQYSAASVLMGSALFFVYALPSQGPGSAASLRWAKPLLASAALLLTAGTLLGLVAQTALLAGSFTDALTPDALTAVVSEMDLGKAAIARAGLAVLAAVCLAIVPRGRPLWLAVGVLGTLACATFGWMGHAAADADEGQTLHLIADIAHALAAAMWVGALAAFVGLVASRRQNLERLSATAAALQRFSPLGIALVATLVATGLVNASFLIGSNVGTAVHDPYGQLLALKLVLFAGMLALATLHRQRAVPALVAKVSSQTLPQQDALASMRLSLLGEAFLGVAVLAAVAWLGTLPPPGS